METGTETAETSAQETTGNTTATDVETSSETDGIDWKAKAREWERRAKENKSAADDKRTVEQKLAELEAKHAEAEARMQRSEIASKYGIAPEDRDLFLTGSDPAALEAQAKRLAERIADTKKNGNVARNEGDTKSTGNQNGDEIQFVSQLFGGSD